MYDLRSSKARKINSVSKSNTAVALPGIHKTIALQQSSGTKNKSSYLDTISYMTHNVDYQKKDVMFVNKQQNRLKSILKKMNYDTMQLLNHARPKKTHKIQNRQMQSQTVEKEVDNSRKIINNLQFEIEHLKDKYRLIVEQREDLEIGKRIANVKVEIEHLQTSNLEERLRASREGKDLEKLSFEGGDSRLMVIEGDHYFVSGRLDKLRADSARVDQQNNRLINKLKQMQPITQQLETQMLKVRNKQSQQAKCKTRQIQHLQKKNHIDYIKKRMQLYKSSSQVKYYKLLKQLQTQNAIHTMLDNKTSQKETRTCLTKEQINNLQTILGEIKLQKKENSKLVLDYIQSSRKKINDSRIFDFQSSEELRTEGGRTQFQVSPRRKTETMKRNKKAEQIKHNVKDSIKADDKKMKEVQKNGIQLVQEDKEMDAWGKRKEGVSIEENVGNKELAPWDKIEKTQIVEPQIVDKELKPWDQPLPKPVEQVLPITIKEQSPIKVEQLGEEEEIKEEGQKELKEQRFKVESVKEVKENSIQEQPPQQEQLPEVTNQPQIPSKVLDPTPRASEWSSVPPQVQSSPWSPQPQNTPSWSKPAPNPSTSYNQLPKPTTGPNEQS